MMLNLSLNFIIGVLASITAVFILKNIINLSGYIPFKKSRYFKEVEEKIKGMPFIYKDIDSDVLNDFVEIDADNIDINTLKLKARRKIEKFEEDPGLKILKKAIFIGNAGYGKTTFQRHIILSIIKGGRKLPFLYEKEDPIPIYIPLKAIDNTNSNPINRYIIENVSLFNNKNGVNLLFKYSTQGRIFLFLDGYDEIPFIATHEDNGNFVKNEIIDIYNEKNEFWKNCRVWLTSRKEFFEYNPITIDKESIHKIKTVELKGIGKNRAGLTKKIFDKYRSRSSVYRELLSEEYFLQDVDMLGDIDLQNLSYSPLFLTVMCYIYASKVIENNDATILWVNNYIHLINECINLLLIDLDEHKVRNMPKVYRKALLRRRGAYLEEKKAFLVFFAFSLFFEQKSLFNREELKQKIIKFFRDAEFESSSTIVNELDNLDLSYPNIMDQLIYTGIFTIVDKRTDTILFDFPHRRFREVLACDYIAQPETFEQFLSICHRENLSEFLIVVRNSPIYKNTELFSNTLNLIFQKMLDKDRNENYVRIINNLFEFVPNDEALKNVVHGFFSRLINENEINFVTTFRLISVFKPSESFLNKIEIEFHNAYNKSETSKLNFCCWILYYYNKQLLNKIISENLNSAIKNNDNDKVILLCFFDLLIFNKNVDHNLSDLYQPNHFHRLCMAFSKAAEFTNIEQFCKKRF